MAEFRDRYPIGGDGLEVLERPSWSPGMRLAPKRATIGPRKPIASTSMIAGISDVAAAVSGTWLVVESKNSGTAPASASSPPTRRPAPISPTSAASHPTWPVPQWPGPGGERPSVIAERAGVSKQAVNHVLRDLEHLGYLELRPDPDDSRARLVELTERGRALVDAMFEAAAATEQALVATLTPSQRRELKATLTALWQR